MTEMTDSDDFTHMIRRLEFCSASDGVFYLAERRTQKFFDLPAGFAVKKSVMALVITECAQGISSVTWMTMDKLHFFERFQDAVNRRGIQLPFLHKPSLHLVW